MTDVLIVVPAYNESGAIKGVIDDLKLNGFNDILVVDDNSIDDTIEIAQKEKIITLELPINLKTGGAVKAGMQYAVLRGKPCTLIQFDGDGQHKADKISILIEEIENDFDLVIGSRFLGSDGYKSERTRRICIRLFSGFVSIITGTRITDVTSGFRAMSWRAVKRLCYTYPSEYPDAGAVVLANRMNLAITEVPVEMSARKTGKSYFRHLRSLLYPPRTIMSIIAGALARRSYHE